MNFLAFLEFATKLGQQAMWPLFALILLVYGLNQSLRYRSENLKLRRERISDHLNAVSKANKLISGLDREALSEPEFSRVKSEILQVAGIDILSAPRNAQQRLERPLTDTENCNNYNNYNNQALVICFTISLCCLPATLIFS